MMKTHSQVPGRRGGQAMIFLLMSLVILIFVALWNFDLHKILTVKNMSQNAGDAAALAAARWQGITLNLIGDLNLMQAAAICSGDTSSPPAIAELQARLCFVGPMVAMMAAQQAAKNNGMYTHPDFTARVFEHAETVRQDYPTAVGPGGEPLFPEPYPNCWLEYADMLTLLAHDGIAAGPDNAQMYVDYAGDHILLNPDFYDAVAGKAWCWFYLNEPDLLPSYTDYTWWSPLPPVLSLATPMNSEYFGLGLTRRSLVDDVATVDLMATLNAQRNVAPLPITTNVIGVNATWYCYHPAIWTEWSAFSPTNNSPFPAAGPIRPQYDYAGADAAVRIEAEAERRTPGAGARIITWTAAGKAFGYLNVTNRPDAFRLVLPAFHDVRLIPVDASSAPAAGAFDIEWRNHIEKHLPGYTDDNGVYHSGYMQNGINALDPDCWYCQQLIPWEDPLFRQEGIQWLQHNSGSCYSGSGPGGPHGGGRRRGH